MKSIFKRSNLCILLIIVVVFSFFFSFKSNDVYNNSKIDIDTILKSKAYAYLPLEAKEYIKEYYNETGEIILTEKNKEENTPYLNPQFIEYLKLTNEQKEEYGIAPNNVIIDFVNNGKYASSSANLPSKYDLREVDTDEDGIADKNYITPIKNQGLLGICWAFAAIESAESNLLVKNDETYTDNSQKFSVRQLDYGTSTNGINGYTNQKYGDRKLAEGGFFSTATRLMLRGMSLYDSSKLNNDLLTFYPAEFYDVLNFKDSLYDLTSTKNMSSLVFSNVSDNEKTIYLNTIKQLIIDNGGPSVSTQSPGKSCSAKNLSDDKYIIRMDNNCNTIEGRHAMQIIGWDDNYEYKYCINNNTHEKWEENCDEDNTVTGKGAWILRNSWGNDDHPYLYLAYDSLNTEINFVSSIEKKENYDWDYFYSREDNNLSVTKISNNKYRLALSNNIDIDAKLKMFKIDSAGQNNELRISISENGDENSFTFVGEIETDLSGLYTLNLNDKNININKNSIIEVSSNNIVYSPDFYLFTKENSDVSVIKTNDLYYRRTNQEDVDYTVYLYSNTYNIKSGEEINYEIYDSNGNNITNDIDISYNHVAANNINTKLVVPNISNNDYYLVKTFYKGNMKSESKIFLSDTKPALGSGTLDDPYVIKTPDELYMINYNMNAYYVLGNDIDLTYDTQNENGLFYNDGQGWIPIGSEQKENFSGGLNGYYNGEYHKIIGLYSNTSKPGGLFYIIANMKDTYSKLVGNLIFEKAIIKNNSVLSNAIIGYRGKTLSIENIAIMNSTIESTSSSASTLCNQITSLGENAIKIKNIYTDSVVKTIDGSLGGLATTIDTDEMFTTNASMEVTNIQIMSNLYYAEEHYLNTFASVIRGGVNLSNIIDFTSAYYNGTRKSTNIINSLSSSSNNNTPNINNMYYNKTNNLVNNKSSFNSTNVIEKEISDLRNESLYADWQGFDDNWIIRKVDGIDRIPVLKFVPFEYTSIDNININYGEQANLYDYVNPKIDKAKDILYEIEDTTIATIDEEGNISGLKKGITYIHVISNYDGYEKDVPITVNKISGLTINYDANGGVGTMKPTFIQSGKSGETSANSFTRIGYKFKSWNTRADGTGTKYPVYEKIINEQDEDYSMTLYAIWEPVNHNVVFYANNGTYEGATQVVLDSVDTQLRINTFVTDSHLFKNWNTKSDGTGTSYSDGQVIAITSDLHLYAIWEEIDYEIKNYTVDEDNNYIDKIEVNTPINTFTSNIRLGYGYGIEVDYKMIDNKQVLYTGGKTRITHGIEPYAEYTNVVNGDVTGDGKINYLDYVNVYNHIQKVKHTESDKKLLINEYLVAADMSGDGKINYMDYIRIYNKIKELKS